MCQQILHKNAVNILIKSEELNNKNVQHHTMYLDCHKYQNDNNVHDVIFDMKLNALTRVIDYTTKDINRQAIIFCDSIDECVKLNDEMILKKYSTVIVHEMQSAKERKYAIRDFMQINATIMITTGNSVLGFDCQTLKTAVNFTMPSGDNYKESYMHRAGRCGRFGKHGDVINLCVKNCTVLSPDGLTREPSDISKVFAISKYFKFELRELFTKDSWIM
jgi:superfamily II DNA/RNA helicase